MKLAIPLLPLSFPPELTSFACLRQHGGKAYYPLAGSSHRASHRDRAKGWRIPFTPSLHGRSCSEAVGPKASHTRIDLEPIQSAPRARELLLRDRSRNSRSEGDELDLKRKQLF